MTEEKGNNEDNFGKQLADEYAEFKNNRPFVRKAPEDRTNIPPNPGGASEVNSQDS